MSQKARSVILLSGGLDSAANLALCRERDEPVLALTFNYGQRAAQSEIRAARAFCEIYDVRHETLDLHWLGALGGSSLTDSSISVPELKADQLDDGQVTTGSAKAVWVPNRNGVLINIAAAWAERLGAEQVVVGFNREEAATFPDNTADFMNRSSSALALSTANGVKVNSYTVNMDKAEIVAALRALRTPFPFDRVWSCYHGGDSICGKCESCRRFARAVGSGAKADARGVG